MKKTLKDLSILLKVTLCNVLAASFSLMHFGSNRKAVAEISTSRDLKSRDFFLFHFRTGVRVSFITFSEIRVTETVLGLTGDGCV